VVLNES